MTEPSPPAPRAHPEPGGRSGPGLLGWPLVLARLLLLLLALVFALGVFYALAPFTRHNPAPSAFLRVVAAIAGLRLRRCGAPPARGQSCVLLANHVSWLDIPALAGASGCAFVAHDGLAAIGPMRWLCELNDTVFVARHDRASITRQIAQVRTALAEAGSLTLFPEGTTNDGRSLNPFKSSLLSALDSDLDSLPVRPVWLDYGPRSAEIAWVGDEPGLANALRLLARWRPIDLTIHFLSPLPPEARTSRKTIATAARAAIEDAMSGQGATA